MVWLRRVGIALLLLVLFTGAVAWMLLQRSLPDYDTSVAADGLENRVEIIRTEHAIPHIFGMSDPDVFFGLGYAHAQDRMFQMELLRRTAKGRLSELLGTPTIATDELLLRLGLYQAAEASLAVQDGYTLKALQAYADGVNARIEETRGFGAAAPEFLLFPVELTPWQPADSLAILKLLALQLASQIDKEVTRARVVQILPPDRLADILPDSPVSGFVNASQQEATQGQLPSYPVVQRPRTKQAWLHPAAIWPDGLASNAWLAGPSRSSTGASILANDTHLNFGVPTVWYLARLEMQHGAILGGTIPGIPMVLSGMSPHIAWGLTAANMDDQDVFIERLNPNDPDEVLTPQGFESLESHSATIPVRGADPVEITLQWSRNGPVIPGKYYNLDTITPEGHVATIARTLFDKADTTLSASHQMLQARDVHQAIAAMQGFITPAQNLSLADRDNIAFQMIGAMPHRLSGHTAKARLPAEGWKAVNRWYGYLPYDLNPKPGVYGNTNSKTIEAPFPNHTSFEWGDTQRIFRLEKLLATDDKHSPQSFAAMQMDTVSDPAQRLVPLLAALLPNAPGQAGKAVEMLVKWDGAMDEDRAEPLIYAAWLRALQFGLSQDELGDVTSAFLYADPLFLTRVLTDVDGAAVWCDDVTTNDTETCAETAGNALDQALTGLTTQYGGDPLTMRWGDVHIATHDHQVLGKLPVLNRLVNIRQSTPGGNHTLLRGLMHGKGDKPLQNLHGALYRAVYDMSDPQASVFIISTGQSGHPMSRHYRDLGKLWLKGDFAPMLTDRDAIAGSALGTTILLPQ